MRIESSVTTLSWIPSEAVTGPANKTVFESGITHYDSPPPDVIGDLDSLRDERPVPLRQPAVGVRRGRRRRLHHRRRLHRWRA